MPRCHVHTRVAWSAAGPAAAVLQVRAATYPGQRIVDEHLDVSGADLEDAEPRPEGSRPVRLHAHTGPVQLRYVATVDLEPPDAPGPDTTPLPSFGALDLDLLPWTQPSRYCPADLLTPTAVDLFGAVPRTAALLERIRAWVASNVAYVPGTSDVHTGADETMLRRTGVCRDLAHLAVTFLRSLDVPARVVSGYALGLQPPDVHLVVEAHDGHAWRLLDATGLAPTATVTRIAHGRDAAEVAWGATDGPLTLTDLEVAVTRA